MNAPLNLTVQDYREISLQRLVPADPPPIWDWACQHLVLDRGRFRPRRARLMRHWLDLATARLTGRPIPGDPWAHRTEEIYLATAAQVAKTTLLDVIFGWSMLHRPGRMAFFGKRDTDLSDHARDRLLPMIEKTPQLRDLLPRSQKAREQALRARRWSIAGTRLYHQRGNVAEDWRSHPFFLMLLDEFDVYPRALGADGKEGDWYRLGKVRQRTYPYDRLMIGTSTTTTITGHCWRHVCRGSHERPLVACPDCGAHDYLERRQVCLPGDRKLAQVSPDEILEADLGRWACRGCGVLHDSRAVRAMVLDCERHGRGGRWVAGTWSQPDGHPDGIWQLPDGLLDQQHRLREIPPPETIVRSGWCNSLYSIDVTLSMYASAYAMALQGSEEDRRAFLNVEDASPYIHVTTETSVDDLQAHATKRHSYGRGSLPDVGIPIEQLVLVFDQQGNTREKYWFPWILVAIGAGGESWRVDVGRAKDLYARDELEERAWLIGTTHRVADVVIIDGANPNFRPDAYLWAADDMHRRKILRGDGYLKPGELWVQVPDFGATGKRRKRAKPPGVEEYRIHPHHWRQALQDRVMARAGQPGWWTPVDLPRYYWNSLAAEEPVTKTRKVPGGGTEEVIVWQGREVQQPNGDITYRSDDHWADCEKMLAAWIDIADLSIPTDTTTTTQDDEDHDAGDPLGAEIEDLVDDAWD